MNKLIVASLVLFGLVLLVESQSETLPMPKLTKSQINRIKALFPKMGHDTQLAVLRIRVIFTDPKKTDAQKRSEIRSLYDGLRGQTKVEMDQLAAIIFPNGIPPRR